MFTNVSESMGSDGYTEIQAQGWMSRLGNAFLGIPIGLILLVASLVVLFWNEGRSVRTARALAEGKAAVVSTDADRVDAARNGKLVHVSGLATTDQTLKDPQLRVSAPAIRLQRIVKMYQWRERSETKTQRKLGGGQEQVTTVTYSKDWSDTLIDSTKFKKPGGHENPHALPWDKWSADAEVVKLGAFRLPGNLVSQINKSEPLPVGDSERDSLPPELKDRLKVDHGHGQFYLGTDPGDPRVGDLTIEFRQVRPSAVSVLAQQAGDSFQPYQTRAGGTINRLQMGTASAEEMFHAAAAENDLVAWLLRLAGFVVMAIGLAMILGPLAVVADVVPFLGEIIRFGTGFIAIGVALVLSTVTIALGWIAYRPVIGVAVLIMAGGALIGFLLLVAATGAPPSPSDGYRKERVKSQISIVPSWLEDASRRPSGTRLEVPRAPGGHGAGHGRGRVVCRVRPSSPTHSSSSHAAGSSSPTSGPSSSAVPSAPRGLRGVRPSFKLT